MTTVPRRVLGRTGVEVSTLAYGGLELYGPPYRTQPGVTVEEADAVLRALLDSGVNYVDTAPDYGESEAYLGKYLSEFREEWFIASKCGCPTGQREQSVTTSDAHPAHDYRPASIVAGVEQSLHRLRTDYLDLVQIHMNPSRHVLESTGAVETLQDLQTQGKVRFIGCSSVLPELNDQVGMGVFDVFQVPYSGIDRQHENAVTEAARSGAGVVIRGSYGTNRSSAARRPRRLDWTVLEGPVFLELRDGMSPFEFLLRFTISHPDGTAAIVGTKSPVELASNVAAVKRGPLTADTYEEAKRLFTELGSCSD